MIIETWVAAFIFLAVCGITAIALLGWINEGQKLARKVKQNEKLIAENERLRKIISQMNGIHNIEVADAFAKRCEEVEKNG